MGLKRSKFNLSHYHLLTADMGKLVPIGVQDVLPGDTFVGSTSALVRMSPMVAPVMHPIECSIHHWFVPYRLLWPEFEDFITGGSSGIETPAFPQVEVTNAPVSSLHDYFGIPTEKSDPISVSALPYRAYALIYNNFYRDQDLEQEIPISYADGADDVTNTELQNVAWSKDYFTTARPWTQKGPDVTVPIYPAPALGGSSAGSAVYQLVITADPSKGKVPKQSEWCSFLGTIFSNATTIQAFLDNCYPGMVSDNSGFTFRCLSRTDSSNSLTSASVSYSIACPLPSGTPDLEVEEVRVTAYGKPVQMSGTLAVTDLRLATALQRMQEARAKYGSRYVDYLAYYGVRCSDARLQLPEYLGGGKNLLQISEVLQTAPDADSYVGDMYGHGIMSMRSNKFKFFAEEHGVIISLMKVLPYNMYSDGVDRMWLKTTKDEFYQKELNAIGMQEIYNAELFVGPENTQKAVFGYQDRYNEYRHAMSRVHGDFRKTMDYWHMARQFSQQPVLNASFIKANPTKRIFAEQNSNCLWIMAKHHIKAFRCLPKRAQTKIL